MGIGSDGSSFHDIAVGSVTRIMFKDFIERLTWPDGTIILMDNCSTHKKLESTFLSKGYIPLFLSPYSPQFQPIELAFSKIKQTFRQCWPWENSVIDTIDSSSLIIDSKDIKGYFREAIRHINSENI
jgi:transposase